VAEFDRYKYPLEPVVWRIFWESTEESIYECYMDVMSSTKNRKDPDSFEDFFKKNQVTVFYRKRIASINPSFDANFEEIISNLVV